MQNRGHIWWEYTLGNEYHEEKVTSVFTLDALQLGIKFHHHTYRLNTDSCKVDWRVGGLQ
jgi:hypothetical protein